MATSDDANPITRAVEWFNANPASPALPTLLDQKDWADLVTSIDGAVPGQVLRQRYVASGFENTPWGGMQRVKVSRRNGEASFEALHVTIVAPPQPGQSAATKFRRTRWAVLFRRRMTAEHRSGLKALGDKANADAVSTIARERLSLRAWISGGVGILGGGALMTAGAPGELGLVALTGLAGAVLGGAAPSLAAVPGRKSSRSFRLQNDEDPRVILIQMLQFYLAHRRDLGDDATELISLVWRSLYTAAEADVEVPAVAARLTGTVEGLVEQLAVVCAAMEQRAEVEREVRRPRNEAIQDHIAEQGLEKLAEHPHSDEIAELTERFVLETEARRAALRKLRDTE